MDLHAAYRTQAMSWRDRARNDHQPRLRGFFLRIIFKKCLHPSGSRTILVSNEDAAIRSKTMNKPTKLNAGLYEYKGFMIARYEKKTGGRAWLVEDQSGREIQHNLSTMKQAARIAEIRTQFNQGEI